jgi:head-tail adaptor
MRARRLRARLQIYRPVKNESATGNVDHGWELFLERWAEVIPARGREAWEAGRTQEQTPMTVRLRYDSQTAQIDASFRAGTNGPDLAIISAHDPDMMRRTIEIALVTGIPG